MGVGTGTNSYTAYGAGGCAGINDKITGVTAGGIAGGYREYSCITSRG